MAADNTWVSGKTEFAKARLISQNSSISPESGEVLVAVEIQLAPGWHTYWKNPGDLGLAPSNIEWKLPEDWGASPFLFPVPDTFDGPEELNQTSFGYEDKAYYLAYLTKQSGAESVGPLHFEVSFNFLICKELCIPEGFRLPLKIEAGEIAYSQHANLLTEVAAKVPFPTTAVNTEWLGETELRVDFLEENVSEVLFYSPDERSKFWNATRLSAQEAESREALSSFDIRFQKPLNQLELTGVIGKGKSKTGVSYSVPPRVETASTSFALIMLFAFLGGLILNLMPCVLPVLVLKAKSLMGLSQKTEKVRSSLLLTVLGILVSFLAIGVLTASLKSVGYAVGWGFQFQNPGFITFMIIVIFLFALNLFSVFEVRLPSSVNSGMAEKGGAFFEGVFATLLATPCSAPFLGAALTYALTQDTFSLFVLFFVMGMGLAAPYILLALQPKLLRFLPRPGAWMNTLKNILGYVLVITCIWLLSILFQLTDYPFPYILLAGLTLSFMLIKEFKSRLRWVIASVGLLALVVGSGDFKSSSIQARDTNEVTISQFTSLQESNEAFFLYITADWCLTCKYNEATIIKTQWFEELLEEADARIYKVDWTSQDPEVADFLESYGRVGIPFAILVDGSQVKVFPELMTKSNTKETIADFFD